MHVQRKMVSISKNKKTYLSQYKISLSYEIGVTELNAPGISDRELTGIPGNPLPEIARRNFWEF